MIARSISPKPARSVDHGPGPECPATRFAKRNPDAPPTLKVAGYKKVKISLLRTNELCYPTLTQGFFHKATRQS